MRGFGRYSILNQEHARAAAQNGAAKERKDASREVSERRLERRDRDQSLFKAARAEARPSIVENFDLGPSRPMTADAWSRQLPNGPAPGESERGYIVRRGVLEQQVREQRQTKLREAAAVARVDRIETTRTPRNRTIQAILDRRAAKADAQQSRDTPEKERWLGPPVGED